MWVLVLWLLCGTVQSVTVTTCTATALATAITNATTGEVITLQCPAGTVVPFTQSIVVTKSIVLEGGGELFLCFFLTV